jgi:L-iditol 2-dehydrogenase
LCFKIVNSKTALYTDYRYGRGRKGGAFLSKKIKAAVLYEAEDVRIDLVDMPEITEDDQVLVKIRAVGICGSDIHYYKHGRIGSYIVEKPMILGHESAGEVVSVGKNVKTLKVGDRVALEPGVPCGKCEYCKKGRYNLCSDVKFMATPPIDGALVEYVVHPAEYVYNLPDNLSFAEGALIEPLAVGMHATRIAEVQSGDRVAILGSGPIGLVTMQAARAKGAAEAIAVDINDFRLNLAKKLGATHLINAKEEDVCQRIKELTNDEGVDIVFETAGTAITTQQTVEVVKKGGTVVLIGLGAQDVIPINTMKLIWNEIKVQCVQRYANVYDKAISLVSNGRIDLKSMITGEFSLDKTEEALVVADKDDKAVKSVINL